MASKTPHIVQGLSRTPLLFIPRYLTNIFFKNVFKNNNNNLENRQSENLKFQKPRFTNKCPEGGQGLVGVPGQGSRSPRVPPVAVSRFPQLEETSSPSLRSWSKSSHAKVPKRNFQFPSICFAICFFTNQHTTEVEALLTRQISSIFRRASFPNFEISRFPDARFRKNKFEKRWF